jgi:hypothetical protein
MKPSVQQLALITALPLALVPMRLLAEPVSYGVAFAGSTLSPLSSLSSLSPLSPSSSSSPLSTVVAINFTPPPPPPDRSAPGNRGEGASRGCIAGNQPLTALVPTYEQTLDSNQGTITQVWGLTSAEHPHFWFYVPYESNSVRAIEFVLQDDQDETLYRTSVSIPSKVGIVGVQVPSTANPLEPNRRYHWFFKVRTACDPNQPETLEYVEGWVQRQSLEAGLRDRISQASPQQRAALYAENGIWHDALTTLAEQRRANPNDGAIAKDWTDLLRAVGLENLANQPLLE